MADKWIVSEKNFRQHPSKESAEAEANRLREKLPKKSFRIYRIKTSLEQSNAAARIAALEQKIKELEICQK